MATHIDREELRKLIRAALKEALGEESPPREGGKPSARRPSPLPGPSPREEGERASFPTGVLTETKLAELAKAHSKIVVGNDVAVTPLARDRARELKIEIVRQKP